MVSREQTTICGCKSHSWHTTVPVLSWFLLGDELTTIDQRIHDECKESDHVN
jgi:hypothetical protein